MAVLKDVREVLHWVVDAVSKPGYEGFSATPDEVRQAIDDIHGYTPPEAALAPEEETQLNALLAKQRDFDAAKAAAAAEVDHAPAE
jgi:hypothetical protein